MTHLFWRISLGILKKIPQRSFRDRDHLRTKDGLYFTVVGNVHPSDRIIAYLKYYPNFNGGKVKNRVLKRAIKHYNVPNIIKTIEILEKKYPHYITSLEPYGFNFSAVPIEYLEEHFLPEKKLLELLETKNQDVLSQKAANLALRLSKECKLSIGNFGITGSILIGIHNPIFSDIDITVYGKESSIKVKETLLEIFKKNDEKIRRANGEFLSTIKKRFPYLNEKELKIFYQRKWNRGTFEGRFFSINPVRTEKETREKYGDLNYIQLDIVEIKAKVEDSSENMFIPAIYRVDNVNIIKGPNISGIEEIVSYDRNYGDVAEYGEKIICKGKLEKVIDNRINKTHYRVTIGSLKAKGTDYLKINV